MIVALAGGVGGAKLADGLYRTLPAGQLRVVVNTADDLDLFGLRICPDVDTVMYTLAGLANPETGWGIAGDTFEALAMLSRYERDVWFKVGDRDFATHIARTDRLRAGLSLTAVTSELCRALGIQAEILPMADEPIATRLLTGAGSLEFQDYFVRRHHEDLVIGVEFHGIAAARPTSAVQNAVSRAEAIIFCPSNPIVSIGPILAVPGLRDLLIQRAVPKVGVSPIVGGRALRGPADRMLGSLGHEISAYGVAKLYQGILDGFVIDEADARLAGRIESLGMHVLVTPTIMTTTGDRADLAMRVLDFCTQLRQESSSRL
ncbi:MAG TPA: 2-phospho-L-lactate transferase [Chloroflexota bacterium]|nr:2-phospho-L-lactate transferase [Chloroflexota bacterium]